MKNVNSALQEREENFQRNSAYFISQGYQFENVKISFVKANVMALCIGLLLSVIMCIGYAYVIQSDTLEIHFMLLVYILLFVFAHELLHGITFALVCKEKWKGVQFGIDWKHFAPYCCCLEPLHWKAYAIGGMMPFFIISIVFYIVSILTGNMTMLLISICNAIGAGGDILVVLSILKNRNGIFLDLPKECGFTRFYKEKNTSC